MAIGNESSIATRRTNGTESSRMEPQPQHQNQTCRSVGRLEKRWEDQFNDSIKPEETEATKGNERKNNDTWIKVAPDRERNGKRIRRCSSVYQGAYRACGEDHSPRTRLTLIGWPIATRRFPCRRGKVFRRSPRSLLCLRSKAFTKDQTSIRWQHRQGKRSLEGLMSVKL